MFIQDYEYTQQNESLALTGYIRGNAMSANRLIHLPNGKSLFEHVVGDFQISNITTATDPFVAQRKNDMAMDEPIVLDQPNELQESLITQNEVDPMEGEQTWPTDQELQDAEGSFLFNN